MQFCPWYRKVFWEHELVKVICLPRERNKRERKWGMTLNFISSDALAPGGPLHYTFMGQKQSSLLSPCFFYFSCLHLSLPHTCACYLQSWSSFCWPQSAACVVSAAFDLRRRQLMWACAYSLSCYFSSVGKLLYISSCQCSTGRKMDEKQCDTFRRFTVRAWWHFSSHCRHWNTFQTLFANGTLSAHTTE